MQRKQVIAHFFGLLSTTAGKASEVVIPVEPINLSPAIVFYGGVTLIGNVVWQGAVAWLETKTVTALTVTAFDLNGVLAFPVRSERCKL